MPGAAGELPVAISVSDRPATRSRATFRRESPIDRRETMRERLSTTLTIEVDDDVLRLLHPRTSRRPHTGRRPALSGVQLTVAGHHRCCRSPEFQVRVLLERLRRSATGFIDHPSRSPTLSSATRMPDHCCYVDDDGVCGPGNPSPLAPPRPPVGEIYIMDSSLTGRRSCCLDRVRCSRRMGVPGPISVREPACRNRIAVKRSQSMCRFKDMQRRGPQRPLATIVTCPLRHVMTRSTHPWYGRGTDMTSHGRPLEHIHGGLSRDEGSLSRRQQRWVLATSWSLGLGRRRGLADNRRGSVHRSSSQARVLVAALISPGRTASALRPSWGRCVRADLSGPCRRATESALSVPAEFYGVARGRTLPTSSPRVAPSTHTLRSAARVRAENGHRPPSIRLFRSAA